MSRLFGPKYECDCVVTYSEQHTNKVARYCAWGIRLSLGLCIHLLVGFAHQWQYAVVAVCDTLEHILNTQQFHNSLRMIDIGVGEQPRLYLRGVQALQKLPQLRIRLQNMIQRESIVDFIVELKRVDLVMARQAFNGQPVLFVIFLVEHKRIFRIEVEVLDEELIWIANEDVNRSARMGTEEPLTDQLLHFIMNVSSCVAVSTTSGTLYWIKTRSYL